MRHANVQFNRKKEHGKGEEGNTLESKEKGKKNQSNLVGLVGGQLLVATITKEGIDKDKGQGVNHRQQNK
jgi:hypothetical protein